MTNIKDKKKKKAEADAEAKAKADKAKAKGAEAKAGVETKPKAKGVSFKVEPELRSETESDDSLDEVEKRVEALEKAREEAEKRKKAELEELRKIPFDRVSPRKRFADDQHPPEFFHDLDFHIGDYFVNPKGCLAKLVQIVDDFVPHPTLATACNWDQINDDDYFFPRLEGYDNPESVQIAIVKFAYMICSNAVRRPAFMLEFMRAFYELSVEYVSLNFAFTTRPLAFPLSLRKKPLNFCSSKPPFFSGKTQLNFVDI